MNKKNDDYDNSPANILNVIRTLKDSPSVKTKLLYLQKLKEDWSKQAMETMEKDFTDIKGNYYKEYAAIEQEISKIISGETIPLASDEDCNKYQLPNITHEIEKGKGIPDYWFTVLENSDLFEMNKKDVEILAFLTDIKVKMLDDNMSFSVEFYFSENDYLNNNVISKTYYMDQQARNNFIKAEPSQIQWKTQRPEVRNAKNGKRMKSFFDIFYPAEMDNQEQAEEGNLFKDDIVPFSMEYYLNLQTDEEEEGEEGHESN